MGNILASDSPYQFLVYADVSKGFLQYLEMVLAEVSMITVEDDDTGTHLATFELVVVFFVSINPSKFFYGFNESGGVYYCSRCPGDFFESLGRF